MGRGVHLSKQENPWILSPLFVSVDSPECFWEASEKCKWMLIVLRVCDEA